MPILALSRITAPCDSIPQQIASSPFILALVHIQRPLPLSSPPKRLDFGMDEMPSAEADAATDFDFRQEHFSRRPGVKDLLTLVADIEIAFDDHVRSEYLTDTAAGHIEERNIGRLQVHPLRYRALDQGDREWHMNIRKVERADDSRSQDAHSLGSTRARALLSAASHRTIEARMSRSCFHVAAFFGSLPGSARFVLVPQKAQSPRFSLPISAYSSILRSARVRS